MSIPTIKISASQADATLTQSTTLTAGMQNLPVVKFAFTDEWADLGKTAVVRAGNVEEAVLVVNDRITVPASALETAGVNLIIGVYGANENIVIPTVWCSCGEILDGTSLEDATNIGEPTADLVDQMLGYAADIQEIAETLESYVITEVDANDDNANAYGTAEVEVVDTGAGSERSVTFYFKNLKGNGIESITWSAAGEYRGRIQITESNGTVTNFDALIDAINYLEELINLAEAYAKGTVDGVDVEPGDPGYQDNAKYYAGMAEDAEDGAEAAQEAAETAQGKAEDAQEAAEAAQTAAEAAQAAAEEAASDASGSATDASTSAQEAAGYADAASASVGSAAEAQTAAETAQNLAEQAQSLAESAESNAQGYATAAGTQALKSEGYAVGEQNGSAVSSGTYYHNNAKYYSDNADYQASAASSSASSASTNALKAEGHAIGKQNGADVGSGSDYYHNNAKYYADEAADSATEAEGYALGTNGGQAVGSDSPYYHNNSKYYSEQSASSASDAADSATAAATSAATFETDTTLSVEGKAADAKAVGDAFDDVDDAIADLDETKADIDGYYDAMTVGNAEQLVATVGVEDNAPYNFRTTGGSADVGDRKTMEIVGGTIAWNQIYPIPASDQSATAAGITVVDNRDGSYTFSGTAESGWNYNNQSITFVKDHKVLVLVDSPACITWPSSYSTRKGDKIINIGSGDAGSKAATFYISVGDTFNNITVRPQIFDLTQMFGSAIADYVYSLGHDGAAAWFRHLFPKPYYAYNAGELMSVNTSANIARGFNAWDGESESGRINTSTGEPTTVTPGQRTKNFVPVIPATTYYILTPSNEYVYIIEYDADKSYVRYASYYKNAQYTTGSKAHYIKFYSVVNTGLNGVCINLSWDGERDGEYEAYEEHTYALDPSLTLRGIPKLDSGNKLYYDGDTYEDDGTVTRKYAVVYSGNCTIDAYSAPRWRITLPSNSPDHKKVDNTAIGKMMCSFPFAIVSKNTQGNTKYMLSFSDSSALRAFIFTIDPESVTTVEQARTWVANHPFYIVYELDTPTTESADPYQSPQIINDFGTEEFVDYGVDQQTRDVAVPVGHNSVYAANLRAKLEMAPDSPDGDGDYIVRQTNGTNEYVPLVIPNELPDLPPSDGTYRLQVVVSGSTKTLSWVSA